MSGFVEITSLSLHLLWGLFELSILLAETLAKAPWEENCPLCSFESRLSFFLELGSSKFILPLRDILGGSCPFWCLGSRAQIRILYLLPSYNLCNFPSNIKNYAFPSCSFDRILALHLEKTVLLQFTLFEPWPLFYTYCLFCLFLLCVTGVSFIQPRQQGKGFLYGRSLETLIKLFFVIIMPLPLIELHM